MQQEEPVLFQGRYRTTSTRLRGWDYASAGMYFVTICTKHKIPWFGEVQNHRVHLSEIGRMVDDEWTRTAIIRPYVTLDEYVVMPDHVHAIIMIHERNVAVPCIAPPPVEPFRRNGSTKNVQRPPPGSLGSIINQFKSVCTKRIRAAGHPHFAWQPSFYDHVIRHAQDTIRIRRYIINNPSAWTVKHASSHK